ncbi:MAG: M14 family zinc carboxypeptidase [bacterium]
MHEQVKESAFLGRYISEEIWLNTIDKLSSKFKVKSLGESVESRPIYSVEFGKGETKILLWSQMHGNESTSTKAIFDLFNFFDQNSQSDLLQKFRFHIIPMLNPDGAFRYTRVNANEIDLNRDAKNLTQPESIILKDYFQTIQPDYCFNLHGQRTIFGTENSIYPATMSFLAPAADDFRTVTNARLKSMYIIGEVFKAINNHIPNHIGLYDDTHNANCVGDTFQALEVPTILFEAGHYPNDYDREFVRKIYFSALLEAFSAINNIPINPNNDIYNSIPKNKKCFYDIILRNVLLDGYTSKTDIAFQYEEILADNTIHFIPKVAQIGSLQEHFGHKEVNCKGAAISGIANQAINENYSNDFVLINNEKFSLKLTKN